MRQRDHEHTTLCPACQRTHTWSCTGRPEWVDPGYACEHADEHPECVRCESAPRCDECGLPSLVPVYNYDSVACSVTCARLLADAETR